MSLIRTGQIVDGDIVVHGNKHSSSDIKYDLDYKKVISAFVGVVGIDIDFPFAKVGAGAVYAQDMASNAYSSNFLFHFFINPGKLVLRPKTTHYTLTPTGVSIANASAPEDRLKRAGDEYIQAIEYGASVIANMKIQYRTKKEKELIAGFLKVEGGVVDVGAAIGYLSEKDRVSVKISVELHQFGGDPRELKKAIPNHFVFCTIDKPQECFDVFSNVIRYAKNDFPNQLINHNSPHDTSYNALAYETSRYADDPGDQLRKLASNITVPNISAIIIRDMNHLYEISMKDEQRAFELINRFYGELPIQQEQDVKLIKEYAMNNMRKAAEVLKVCYNDPYNATSCDTKYKNTKAFIKSYDNIIGALEIGDSQSVQDNLRCEVAMNEAIRVGEVSKMMADGYRNKSWAPVFFDNANPVSGVDKWIPCGEAQKTYGIYFKP